MTILVKKVFISSKPTFVYLLCPPLCGPFSIQESAAGGLSYKAKKPHNYHKIAVWQKDDRIRKSPLKFCVYYYSELEGVCQASIITELWRLSVVFVLLYGT